MAEFIMSLYFKIFPFTLEILSIPPRNLYKTITLSLTSMLLTFSSQLCLAVKKLSLSPAISYRFV